MVRGWFWLATIHHRAAREGVTSASGQKAILAGRTAPCRVGAKLNRELAHARPA